MSQTVSRKNKGKAPQRKKTSVHFEESEGSSIGEASEDGLGYEMEGWESDLEAPVDPDSSLESVIMVSTPCPLGDNLPRYPKLLSDVILYLLLLLEVVLGLLCVV